MSTKQVWLDLKIPYFTSFDKISIELVGNCIQVKWLGEIEADRDLFTMTRSTLHTMVVCLKPNCKLIKYELGKIDSTWINREVEGILLELTLEEIN